MSIGNLILTHKSNAFSGDRLIQHILFIIILLLIVALGVLCAFFLLTYLSDRLLFPLSLTVFFLSVLLFCSYTKFLACVQFSIFIRCLSNFNIHTNLMARCSDFIVQLIDLVWWFAWVRHTLMKLYIMFHGCS